MGDFFQIIGWVGAILLALCSLPQAIMVFRNKNADGLSSSFLGLWFSGTVLTGSYIVATDPTNLPLLANYGINFCFLCVITFYKCFPERKKS